MRQLDEAEARRLARVLGPGSVYGQAIVAYDKLVAEGKPAAMYMEGLNVLVGPPLEKNPPA